MAFTAEDIITPPMTSNTSPSGECSALSGTTGAWSAYLAFDQQDSGSSGWWHLTPPYLPTWIQYEFDSAVTVEALDFAPINNPTYVYPVDFNIKGSNDGVTWTTLYSSVVDHGLSPGEFTSIFNFSITGSYTHYRMNINTQAGTGEDQYVGSGIGELRYYSSEPIPTVEDPFIIPYSDGVYPGTELIYMGTSTPGAIIYYTTDGSTPDNTDTVYTYTPFALVSSKTIKAIGILPGYVDSAITTRVFSTQVEEPVILPVSGEYFAEQLISISSTTGATIYYTEDGSTPDATDTAYTVPFALTVAKTIKAIGIRADLDDSNIATEVYTIDLTVVTPVILPTSGLYLETQDISMSTGTPGATIYYTTDGSNPDATDILYTAPFDLTIDRTIKAIGIKSGYTNSSIVTEVYTVETGGSGDIAVCDTGTWLQNPTSFTYQWQRDTVDIPNETNYWYIVALADYGTLLRCVVTAINGLGFTEEPSNSISILTPSVPGIDTTDFSEYTIGLALTDWTDFWGNGGFTALVQVNAGTYKVGTNEVAYDVTTQGKGIQTWDDIGNVIDSDVIMKINAGTVSITNGIRIYSRVSGTSGFENAYFLEIKEDEISFNKYTAGQTPVNLSALPFNYLASTSYWVRFQTDGTSLRFKIWAEDSLEPGEWKATETGIVTSSGSVGFGGFETTSDFEVDYFSCGSEGQEPVFPPASYPANTLTRYGVVGASDSTFNWGLNTTALGGPGVIGKSLTGAVINHNGHTTSIRVAIYTGGNLLVGPNGATLLYDFGLIASSTSPLVLTATTPVVIPDNEPVWIVLKSGSSPGFTVLSYSSSGLESAVSGNWQLDAGRIIINNSDISYDPTIAFPTTISTPTGVIRQQVWFGWELTIKDTI